MPSIADISLRGCYFRCCRLSRDAYAARDICAKVALPLRVSFRRCAICCLLAATISLDKRCLYAAYFSPEGQRYLLDVDVTLMLPVIAAVIYAAAADFAMPC